jgi:hypothetical protein
MGNADDARFRVAFLDEVVPAVADTRDPSAPWRFDAL